MQWRELAYCITQLQISDKGLKSLAEHLRCYKHCLTDATVLDTFRGIAARARKAAKAELKDVMVEWERQLTDAAGEVACSTCIAVCSCRDRGAQCRCLLLSHRPVVCRHRRWRRCRHH